MRRLRAIPIAVLLLLACSAAARAAPEPAPHPSCADGPTRVGDTVWGTPCGDTIVAPPGVETVRGGGGNDTIVPAPIAASAPCPDGCHLGVGSQTFDGGPGDDVVYGERGNDTLNGGEGNDHLFGGIGDDKLRGGPGDDQLSGGFGADSIDGEAGDDYVRGDGTIDRIFDTGGGVDTLSYATGITPGFGGTAAEGFPGFPTTAEGRGVRLELGASGENANNGVAPFGGGVDEVEGQNFETVIGTPFSDYIVGTAAAQTIYGGGGADVIVGEGGSDSLDGGADGDYVNGGTVAPRDPTKVSVGFMAPGTGAYSQLYLTGSNTADTATATYAAGSPATVTFDLSAGTFDQSASAAAGCAVTPNQATCTLAAPLDSIVLAGMGGDDSLRATGFPTSVSVVVTGGDGSDTLTGGDLSEDVLVDGPGAGGDVLSALGGDDALLHNGGADQRLGGAGNDLFLSNSICDGDVLNGGAGRDNASWARYASAVEADLGAGKAGRPGVGNTPDCTGGSLDSLQEIEDLEGSSSGDVFYGDSGPNQLLGHFGPDTYFSGAGDDSILANSGDADPVIDCGEGVADVALVDHPQYGDATPIECESVQEADPNNFRVETQLPEPTPSPPAAYARDTTPPRTRIASHPRKVSITTKSRLRVVFRFTSSERGGSFRCKLDRKRFAACSSPRAYLVAPGRHTVRIVAVDSAGNADPTPAVFGFSVRRR